MIEMNTRWRTPWCAAARTRAWVAVSSPRGAPARCSTVSTPATAGATPMSRRRSPTTYSTPSASGCGWRLSTRTLRPDSRSSGPTCRPSVPVPPVTRTGEVIVVSPWSLGSASPTCGEHAFPHGTHRASLAGRDCGATGRETAPRYAGAPGGLLFPGAPTVGCPGPLIRPGTVLTRLLHRGARISSPQEAEQCTVDFLGVGPVDRVRPAIHHHVLHFAEQVGQPVRGSADRQDAVG